jgi:hypothetical protein
MWHSSATTLPRAHPGSKPAKPARLACFSRARASISLRAVHRRRAGKLLLLPLLLPPPPPPPPPPPLLLLLLRSRVSGRVVLPPPSASKFPIVQNIWKKSEQVVGNFGSWEWGAVHLPPVTQRNVTAAL